MGPGRRTDDRLLQIADDTDAEPVDLGARGRPETYEGEPLDLGQRAAHADASVDEPGLLRTDHWMAGLVRPEVLGVSGAAILVFLVIGMPFLGGFETIALYVGPYEVNPAWTFVPSLVGGTVATALGLGGLRQAAYHGAATWARITSGAAALVGLLVAVGAAIAWFILAQSDPFEQFRPPA